MAEKHGLRPHTHTYIHTHTHMRTCMNRNVEGCTQKNLSTNQSTNQPTPIPGVVVVLGPDLDGNVEFLFVKAKGGLKILDALICACEVPACTPQPAWIKILAWRAKRLVGGGIQTA